MPTTLADPSLPHLLSQLSQLLGQDALVQDAGLRERYLVDWAGELKGSALAVVKPSNTQEVVQLVQWCRQNRVGLVPFGGNTGLVGGATPLDDGRQIVVSLERLNGLVDIDPIANTVTVGAGVIL